VALFISGLTGEGTGNDQLSIDLIDGAAAACYVTSEELRYMMVRSWDVGVGKRTMPQAITFHKLNIYLQNTLCIRSYVMIHLIGTRVTMD